MSLEILPTVEKKASLKSTTVINEDTTSKKETPSLFDSLMKDVKKDSSEKSTKENEKQTDVTLKTSKSVEDAKQSTEVKSDNKSKTPVV